MKRTKQVSTYIAELSQAREQFPETRRATESEQT